MRPRNYIIRFKDKQIYILLYAFIVFLAGFLLLIYAAITQPTYSILFISPLFIYVLYGIAVPLINEEIVWEDNGYLKKYNGPIPVWNKFSPLPSDQIVGFFENSKINGAITAFNVNAKLKNGKVVPIVENLDSMQAYDGVRELTNKLRGGALKLLNERMLLRIKSQRNGTFTPKYLDVSNIEEFLDLLSKLTQKLINFQGLEYEYEILVLDTENLLRKNESFTREILLNNEYYDLDLYQGIYCALSKNHEFWEDFILFEIERLFKEAASTHNIDMLSIIDEFQLIDEWKGRKIRKSIRNLLEGYLSSPLVVIRKEVVRLLSVMADDNIQGTINILSDVITKDQSFEVRKLAKKEVKVLRSY
jgi:hypothetical protein